MGDAHSALGRGHALADGLRDNSTMLRLPLQGNRVPEETLRRIESLLARNGSLVPQTDENAEPQVWNGGGVRTRTLEGAITAQQTEFAHKVNPHPLRHPFTLLRKHTATSSEAVARRCGRQMRSQLSVVCIAPQLHNLKSQLEATELDASSERARADSNQARAEAAEGVAEAARQTAVLAEQEAEGAKQAAEVEMVAARQEVANARHREEAADARVELMREKLAAFEKRMEAEHRAITDREANDWEGRGGEGGRSCRRTWALGSKGGGSREERTERESDGGRERGWEGARIGGIEGRVGRRVGGR
ncbi:MAG: hypothetical protein SGPRY_011464 [Prymnesium sp.]